jgi:LCP family protein required for cell wall assembly
LALAVSAPFPSTRRAFLWRCLLALVLVSVLAAAGLTGGAWYLDHKLGTAGEVDVDLAANLPGAKNFLILGSDSRAFVADETDEASFGDTGDVGGQRADAIILARVEPRTHRGLLVSFPRDLRVAQPGRKGTRRINEAFEQGPQGVIDVLEHNFGIPVHHYIQLDFAGFRGMVDAIGGVRMYVPAPVRDRKTGLDVPQAGCVVFDGRQALAWVRSRNFSYLEAGKWRTDPTADIGRIERQQEFIRRLMAQAIRRGALNPLRANRLADAALANLTLDSTFRVRDGLRLVRAFRGVGPAAVEMVAIPTVPSGQQLRVHTKEAEPLLARLRGESDGGAASGTPAPPGVVPSQVRVRVLNGSGADGVAGQAHAAFADAGFAAAGAADAQRFDYSKTEIRHAPGGSARAQLVLSYLKGGGRLVADRTLSGSDVVVILGRDYKGVAERPGSAPAPSSTTAAPPASTSAPAPAPTPAGAPAEPAC